MDYTPLIVGLGGTTRPGSSSEKALAAAMRASEAAGARTEMFAGPAIVLPMYAPGEAERTENAARLVDALRRADGVIISSPGYHGSLSGLIKNALDYVEDLAGDERAYFEGKAVGLIASALGWQATGATLSALRSITHALRGWPTPLGVAINTLDKPFDDDGNPTDPSVKRQLETLGRQVVEFARQREAYRRAGLA
jgi:FMN reductase